MRSVVRAVLSHVAACGVEETGAADARARGNTALDNFFVDGALGLVVKLRGVTPVQRQLDVQVAMSVW